MTDPTRMRCGVQVLLGAWVLCGTACAIGNTDRDDAATAVMDDDTGTADDVAIAADATPSDSAPADAAPDRSETAVAMDASVADIAADRDAADTGPTGADAGTACGALNQPCCGGLLCGPGTTCTAGLCASLTGPDAGFAPDLGVPFPDLVTPPPDLVVLVPDVPLVTDLGGPCGYPPYPCCGGISCMPGAYCSAGLCAPMLLADAGFPDAGGPCGYSPYPCCMGIYCMPGSTCSAGLCTFAAPDAGFADAGTLCGMAGQPCCGTLCMPPHVCTALICR